MADFDTLLPKAAEIRDASSEGENTALRVGTLLVDLIQAVASAFSEFAEAVTAIDESSDQAASIANALSLQLAKALPAEGVVSGEVRELEVWGNVIHLPVVIHHPNGSATVHRYEIPGATGEKAGLYDLATRKAVDKAVSAADSKAASAASAAADAMAKALTAQSEAQAADTKAVNAKTAADNAQATADAAVSLANDAATLAESLDGATNAKIGKPSGIAPLDGGGKVPARHLPSYVDDVVEFGGRVPSVAAFMAVDATEAQAAEGTVVFVNVEARFALRVGSLNYYRRWPGQEAYGTEATAGICPAKGKIYVDTSENRQYRWSGSGFVEMGAPTPIGTDPGEAYPGEEGAQLRRDLDRHLAELSSTALTQSVLAGSGVPLSIAGSPAEIKYRALAIDLPAGRAYEVSTVSKNVARVDMRVVHPDGSVTWLSADLRPGSPFRFTPAKDVAWLGFDVFGSNDATVAIDPDRLVSLSVVIKAVDTLAEEDEAAARRLDSWAVAHAAANAGAAWTRRTLAKGRVALCIDDLSAIQGPFIAAAISAGVPLTIAAVPERLGATLDNGKTGLEICRQVIAAGGEVASHSAPPLKPSSTPADWHEYFVGTRLTLEKAGLKAAGIVKAGGATVEEEAALDKVMLDGYLKAYYTHGVGFAGVLAGDPRYSDWRRNLGAYTYDEFEAELSRVAASKSAIVFYTHCDDIIKGGDSPSHLNKFIEMLGILNRRMEEGAIELTTLKGCTLGALERVDTQAITLNPDENN